MFIYLILNCFLSVATAKQGGSNESSEVSALIQKDPALSGYELPTQEHFVDAIQKKNRTTSLKVDLNNDKLDDLIVLLLNKSKDKATSFLILKGKNGYQAAKELKSEKLVKGKADLVIEIKPSGQAGISSRKYFSSEHPGTIKTYKKSKAVEVSYQEYYCTRGFYFKDENLKSQDACD